MKPKFLLVCLLTSLSSLPLFAGVLVEEDFNYPNGNLAGKSGAEGLGTWGFGGTNGTGTITVDSDKAVLSGTNATWIRNDFAVATSNSVIYFSYDIATVSAPTLASGSITDTVRFRTSAGNDILSVGKRYDATGQYLSLGLGNAAPSSVAVAMTSATTQIVGKLSFNGGTGSELTLWLNPTTEASPTAYVTTWNSGQTSMGRIELLRFVFGNGATTAASSSYDNIRVGTDWNSVAVPEPTTAALAGLAAGGLLAFRYRR